MSSELSSNAYLVSLTEYNIQAADSVSCTLTTERFEVTETMSKLPKKKKLKLLKRAPIGATTVMGRHCGRKLHGTYAGSMRAVVVCQSRHKGKTIPKIIDSDHPPAWRVAAWIKYFEPGGQGYLQGYIEAKAIFIRQGRTIQALEMAVQDWGMNGAESTETEKKQSFLRMLAKEGICMVDKVKRHKKVGNIKRY